MDKILSKNTPGAFTFSGQGKGYPDTGYPVQLNTLNNSIIENKKLIYMILILLIISFKSYIRLLSGKAFILEYMKLTGKQPHIIATNLHRYTVACVQRITPGKEGG